MQPCETIWILVLCRIWCSASRIYYDGAELLPAAHDNAAYTRRAQGDASHCISSWLGRAYHGLIYAPAAVAHRARRIFLQHRRTWRQKLTHRHQPLLVSSADISHHERENGTIAHHTPLSNRRADPKDRVLDCGVECTGCPHLHFFKTRHTSNIGLHSSTGAFPCSCAALEV